MKNIFEYGNHTFQSFRLKISFKNLVSDTEIPSQSIQLAQLGDKSLTFEIPIKSCAQGHNVMVTIFETALNPTPQQAIFTATGKIKSVESLDDGKSQSAALELVQYDEESWAKLEGLFSQRQKEILEFMEAARD